MPRLNPRIAIMSSLAALLGAALLISFRPQAQPVDLTEVARTPLTISVGDEGQARLRNLYTVSAPLAGHLLRIDLRAGDAVAAGTTELARIVPSDPQFLDRRSRQQAEVALRSARAALDLVGAETERARAELDFAQAQARRARELAGRGELSQADLDQAELRLSSARSALDTAHAGLAMRQAELDNARAVLDPQADDGGALVRLHAPVGGRVLRVIEDSDTVVVPGQTLLELGDPAEMEIVVDLLSRDAVRVREGAEVEIRNWGGEQPLAGQVARIEPYGFTRISALGVEEQRVNVIVALTSPASDWTGLHHGYRVDVEITLWRDEVLAVAGSALFREGEQWKVFRVIDDRARLTTVSIGRRNSEHAQLLSGLKAGDVVIDHPAEVLADGDRVVRRAE